MHIAIVGCGQLSRMLALAGIPLGIQFSFIHDNENQATECVLGLGNIQRPPQYDPVLKGYRRDDVERFYNDLGRPDCITVEKEQVDSQLLAALADYCAIYPGMAAITACQHRWQEKQLLNRLNIATSPYFYNVPATQAVTTLGFPVVVKSCAEGYDGKNQWVIKNHQDAVKFDNLNHDDYIIEAFVEFDKEVSQLSVRSREGQILHYALTDNHHEQGILKQSIAPAEHIPVAVEEAALQQMETLLTELNYVGVMAMECFVRGEQLMVNELAPRVHNSGHWTQLGSITCQFENHIRAIAGLGLGSTRQIAATGMINLIGTEQPPFCTLAENSKLYWYNKAVKSNRKLGHINFIGENRQTVSRQMAPFVAV